MEWPEFVLTVVVSAGIGSLFGALTTYFFESRKHRQELEEARMGRILQPLREIRVKLRSLTDSYKTGDDWANFCSNLGQLGNIIEDEIKRHSLDIDLSKESKSLLERLLELHKIFEEARNKFLQKDRQIHDTESKNRLFDEYRMQLYKDEQIKKLVNYLADQVEIFLQKHA